MFRPIHLLTTEHQSNQSRESRGLCPAWQCRPWRSDSTSDALYCAGTDPARKHVSHRRAQFYDPVFTAISAIASVMAVTSPGLISRANSTPSRRKIRVGHSLTEKDRPNSRPLPSSTLRCRRPACEAKAALIKGCARWQWPHQLVPKSTITAPWN